MKVKTRHKWQPIVAAIIVSVYTLWAPRLADAQTLNPPCLAVGGGQEAIIPNA
jgi:hypothetical protein